MVGEEGVDDGGGVDEGAGEDARAGGEVSGEEEVDRAGHFRGGKVEVKRGVRDGTVSLMG